MSPAIPQLAAGPTEGRYGARRVVMVTSPGEEPTLEDVVTNLATVCAEIGQRVVLLSTAGLASPGDDPELELSASPWWGQWPLPGNGGEPLTGDGRARLVSGPVSRADVEDLLGDTDIPGVSRLDVRHFVGHPAQLVIRVPEVLAALREIVDVVILEVPSYVSVHHGEGLTPLVDAVLVVGERQKTTVNEVRRTSAALSRLGAPVVGLALTRTRGRTYDWDRDDEELDDEELDDQELDGDYDTTEQLPLTEASGVTPATSVGESAGADHVPPEA